MRLLSRGPEHSGLWRQAYPRSNCILAKHRHLNDSYFVGHNPNFQLLESLFEPLLELSEKRGVLKCVLYIRNDPHIGLLVMHLLVGPLAMNRLRKKCKSSESCSDFAPSYEELFRLDRPAVVIPGGQGYLVASERHNPGSPTQETRKINPQPSTTPYRLRAR